MKRLALLLWLAMLGPLWAEAIPAGFNDEGITWLRLGEGLKKARAENKPVLLLVHATWCPRCVEFRAQFFDSRVVDHTDDMVFILVDQDREPRDAARYEPDGGYIPRTMVLDPKGRLVAGIHAGRSDFRYFYDTSQPDGLLGALAKARSIK